MVCLGCGEGVGVLGVEKAACWVAACDEQLQVGLLVVGEADGWVVVCGEQCDFGVWAAEGADGPACGERSEVVGVLGAEGAGYCAVAGGCAVAEAR